MRRAGKIRPFCAYAENMKRKLLLPAALGVFAAAVAWPQTAASGMKNTLHLCAFTLVPSLFPLFVLSRLLDSMGLPEWLSRRAGPLMQRLFGVSGAGAEAFFLGLCGGYPLGASVVAQLRLSGRISRAEAERLLAFCNNSGPAFILGAVGGVFASAKVGALLYLAHVLAAVCTGLVFRRRSVQPEAHAPAVPSAPAPSAAESLTAAVSGAVEGCLRLCGYVCFFGTLTAFFDSFRFLPGLGPAFAMGFFELGGGIGALAGWQAGPLTMALAGFLLGWGGLSVHCQTLGAVAKTDIKCARHLLGRALCGTFAAVFSFLFSYLV